MPFTPFHPKLLALLTFELIAHSKVAHAVQAPQCVRFTSLHMLICSWFWCVNKCAVTWQPPHAVSVPRSFIHAQYNYKCLITESVALISRYFYVRHFNKRLRTFQLQTKSPSVRNVTTHYIGLTHHINAHFQSDCHLWKQLKVYILHPWRVKRELSSNF